LHASFSFALGESICLPVLKGRGFSPAVKTATRAALAAEGMIAWRNSFKDGHLPAALSRFRVFMPGFFYAKSRHDQHALSS